MGLEENKAVVQRLFDAINSGSPDELPQVVAPDVVDHNAVIFFMQPEGQGGVQEGAILRIADGRVAELRGTADRLGMLTQLGILPEPRLIQQAAVCDLEELKAMSGGAEILALEMLPPRREREFGIRNKPCVNHPTPHRSPRKPTAHEHPSGLAQITAVANAIGWNHAYWGPH